jgi:sirohydrochlorin cobaltochelatase
MKRRWALVLAWVLGLSLCADLSLAAQRGEKAVRNAILLVAFGTSDPEAQKDFALVEEQARKTIAGVEEVRWAYTSKVIRTKLAKEGKVLDSPEVALARLMDGGTTRVAVLSLHTIPGEEYHELYRNARLFGQMEGGFEKVEVARPLLSSPRDMDAVAAALLGNIPGRKPTDGVLFMGHGTEKHPADAIYLAMNQVLQDLDPNAFVCTVEGRLSLETMLPKLRSRKIRKVYLVPLMSVAGDHARNDMAGEEPESWKSILTRNGFECEAVLRGTAQNPEILKVWMEHLREAVSRLQ